MENGKPLVVSFGGGVDSTAMLIEMKNRGIRPDVILFADTGAERPATYNNVERINAWTKQVGFPEVTTVKYVPPIAPYTSLEGECQKNGTLPSLAFGMKACSSKWKVKPQEKWLKAHGIHERIHAIGLDDSPADRTRKVTYAGKGSQDEAVTFWYPLQEWGIDRAKCVEIIKAEGLPVPIKSCCFFCPAMKKIEIQEQAHTYPDLHRRALEMERGFLEGRHCVDGVKSTKGLGRRFAWGEVEVEIPTSPDRVSLASAFPSVYVSPFSSLP